MNINNFEDNSERSKLHEKLPPIEFFKIEKSERFEDNFLDFKLYMNRKYSGLENSDISRFINKQLREIEDYFKLVEEILFKESRPIGVLYGLKVSEIDKNAYNYVISKYDEVIDFFKALELELFFVSMEILYAFDFDMRQPNLFSTNNDFETVTEFEDLKTYCLLQYETILSDLFYSAIKNPLLMDLEYTNPNLYSLLLKALRNKAIYIKENKLHFPYSQNTVSTFFRENKTSGKNISWKPIISNILLENGTNPNSNIKTAPPAPSTSEYQDLISKILE